MNIQGEDRMEQYGKSLVPVIESVYDSFTTVEKEIADFFIHNKMEMDFSSKNISTLLYVSEASLSRFAKKCGLKGYREFIFRYQEVFHEEKEVVDDRTMAVLNSYQELLNKSYNLLDEDQLRDIVKKIATSKRVYVYGMGSSGLAATEFKIRFIRIGIDVEAITDSHLMKMNSVRINEDSLVIGISISGKTQSVLSSLRAAKERGGHTVLITSKQMTEFSELCDDVILVAVLKNLEYGNVISPQFPILIMLDILYTFLLQSDKLHKEAMHDYTLNALESEG